MLNKNLIFFVTFLICSVTSLGQSRVEKIELTNKKIVEERFRELDIIKPDSIYIRVFKLEQELELWVKERDSSWLFYKTFKMSATSGILGPKRIQGDRQIPEGIYKITTFNPWSNYHLSMRINYPNEADWYNSDSLIAGDGIFIHGGSVTIGCIPITDSKIEEVWTICKMVDSSIPVHIFAIKFDNPKSRKILFETFSYTKEDRNFQIQMEKVFFSFELNKRIPQIITYKGEYIIN